MSVYTDNGYVNRRDYLESLAENYGVELEKVLFIASVLGSIEDFDGLVTTIQDMEYYGL